MRIFKKINDKNNVTNNLRKDDEGHNEKDLTVEELQDRINKLHDRKKELDERVIGSWIIERIVEDNHPNGLDEESKKFMEEVVEKRKDAFGKLLGLEYLLDKERKLLEKKRKKLNKEPWWNIIKNFFIQHYN